jgi:hypothetical protein
MVNWNKFVTELKRDPKNYMRAIIDNLNPPKYAIEQMKEFEFICHFCWKPSIDICNYCNRHICEDHLLKVIGKKTKLEWYFCEDCRKTHNAEEVLEKVRNEDEAFYLEDHPTP